MAKFLFGLFLGKRIWSLPQSDNVVLWDGDKLGALLDRHAEIRYAYLESLTSQEKLEKVLGAPSVPEDLRATDLLVELASIPKGTDGWRRYEETCVKILNYVFIPPLRLPKIQRRTHDGLDRRDAIYPIGAGNSFWDSVKHHHSSRIDRKSTRLNSSHRCISYA